MGDEKQREWARVRKPGNLKTAFRQNSEANNNVSPYRFLGWWTRVSFREQPVSYLERVVVDEGRLSDEHLVQQDPQRPPVYTLPVTLVEEDLRGDVLGRAAEGVGLEGHHLSPVENRSNFSSTQSESSGVSGFTKPGFNAPSRCVYRVFVCT